MGQEKILVIADIYPFINKYCGCEYLTIYESTQLDCHPSLRVPFDFKRLWEDFVHST